MENLIWLLPAVACPVGMGLMMWFMGKGMKNSHTPEQGPAPAAPRSAEQLHSERNRIDAELAELEERDRAPVAS